MILLLHSSFNSLRYFSLLHVHVQIDGRWSKDPYCKTLVCRCVCSICRVFFSIFRGQAARDVEKTSLYYILSSTSRAPKEIVKFPLSVNFSPPHLITSQYLPVQFGRGIHRRGNYIHVTMV